MRLFSSRICMNLMTQGQRVLILGKTKKFKGVTPHSQASMFVFADEQSEEPGEGSLTAKEAQAHIPKEPLHQECSHLNKRKPFRDVTSKNSPAAASSFDEPPSKKHLGAHEGTLPDLGLAIWDRDALLENREARRRRMTDTTANGFNKLNSAQMLAYYRRHETEDILKVIFEHKERAAYEAYFRNATDAAHDASIKATLGQPRSAAIAALALSHSVALYDSLDLILVRLGREKSCVPYTEAKTYDILKRLNDKAPALWVNESVCAKGTHLANHTSGVRPGASNSGMLPAAWNAASLQGCDVAVDVVFYEFRNNMGDARGYRVRTQSIGRFDYRRMPQQGWAVQDHR